MGRRVSKVWIQRISDLIILECISSPLQSRVFISNPWNSKPLGLQRWYSEFHALHKKLKKSIKTPEMPSKHVRNWIPKVLEQRRQGLESYLQTVIFENEELPKIFLDFLNVRHMPSLPKAESCGSIDDIDSEETSKLSHQPVLLFLRDPYVLPAANGNQTCHLLTAVYFSDPAPQKPHYCLQRPPEWRCFTEYCHLWNGCCTIVSDQPDSGIKCHIARIV
uniref:Sorting nexin 24 n=1 Tax=Leptobrachium leishanense TaxID=445787 RepID=A0A8C5MQJ9_9ANUR